MTRAWTRTFSLSQAPAFLRNFAVITILHEATRYTYCMSHSPIIPSVYQPLFLIQLPDCPCCLVPSNLLYLNLNSKTKLFLPAPFNSTILVNLRISSYFFLDLLHLHVSLSLKISELFLSVCLFCVFCTALFKHLHSWPHSGIITVCSERLLPLDGILELQMWHSLFMAK